jgi:hypothetical protein
MPNDRAAHAVRQFVWCAIVAPLVLTIVSVAVQLAMLPRLPEPIAIHWDAAGIANGFAPAWVQTLATVALGLGIPLLIALTALPGLRRGDRGGSYRFMGALACAVSALVALLMTGTLLGQVGLASAEDAPSVVPVLIAGFGAAIAVGVVAWFVQPAEKPLRTDVDRVRPLELAPGERAVWFGSSTIARPALIAVTVASLVISAAAVVVWLSGDAVAAAIATFVAVVVVALAITTTAFRVRIDDSGLTVTSVAGIPRFHVPTDDVVSVAVRDVTPMGEFGGWGMRSVPGRFGVVMRTGPGLDIERRSGRRFVVTIDEDAVTAGALLAALTQPVGRR